MIAFAFEIFEFLLNQSYFYSIDYCKHCSILIIILPPVYFENKLYLKKQKANQKNIDE